MKNLMILAMLLFAVATTNAQELLNSEKIIVVVNDSICRIDTQNEYLVSGTLDGIAYDTTMITIDPTQSIYLTKDEAINYLSISAINEANTAIALVRRATVYRSRNKTNKRYGDQLVTLGANLDSIRIDKFGRQLKGIWIYVDSTGNNATAKQYLLVNHPTRTDVLRMEEVDGPEKLIVFIEGRWGIRVRRGTTNTDYVWNGGNEDRSVFQTVPLILGTNTSNKSRWVKTN